MSRTATLCSYVFKRRNAGLSKGGNTYDNGVPIVLGEVTPTQGTEENSVQGEGEQVAILYGKWLAGREMHKSCLIPNGQRSVTGEPDASKGGTSGSEGAREKSASNGTSRAAYPTARATTKVGANV